MTYHYISHLRVTYLSLPPQSWVGSDTTVGAMKGRFTRLGHSIKLRGTTQVSLDTISSLKTLRHEVYVSFHIYVVQHLLFYLMWNFNSHLTHHNKGLNRLNAY